MDENIQVETIDNSVSVLAMLDNHQYDPIATAHYKQSNLNINNFNHSHNHSIVQEEVDGGESKQSSIWSKNATLMLINLYENKIPMLDNPKKKSKMWISIADELKALNIEVSPDQVRWKINALTKKYKDCIDNGQGAIAFKYFNEMHQVLGRCNDETGTYRLASGVQEQHESDKVINHKKSSLKAPFRKLRAERRAKIELDKQWIEYLKKQEEQKLLRDERRERSLRLKEEELQLKKRELEIKHSLALKKLQLREKKQEEMLKLEREKCALLRKLVANQY